MLTACTGPGAHPAFIPTRASTVSDKSEKQVSTRVGIQCQLKGCFCVYPFPPSYSPSQGPQAAGPPGQQAQPQAQHSQHSHSSSQQGHRGCRKNMGVVNPRPWEFPTPTPVQRAVTWGAGRLIGTMAGGPVSWRPGWSSQLLEAPKWTGSWAPRDPERQGRAGSVISVDERDGDIPGGERSVASPILPRVRPTQCQAITHPHSPSSSSGSLELPRNSKAMQAA